METKIRKTWIVILVISLTFIISQQAISADYYWTGNGGNWTDTSHWATTSGGSTHHSVPPTQYDNVYFDANSFTLTGQAVDITDLAECKNMDWTGATNSPDLSGWSELDVFGSIKLISGMTASFSGTLALWSDDFGNTLDFADLTLNVSLLDVWGYGEWTLASDLSIAGICPISMWSGTLNTGNFDVNVSSLDLAPMFDGDEVYINLGSSTININKLNIFNSLSVHFDAGTSVINLTTDYLNGVGFEFYDVNFKSSGGLRDYEVLDSNTFHILTFEDAASVTFQAGRTTKVDSIVVNGTCAQNVTVQSNNPGSKAYIYKASGAVVSDYLFVNDMEITGGATFTANNSVNLGNVTNWVINGPVGSTNYYWVGGTGNWTDASHWATTSGGAGNGSCIPSLNDKVYFDGNSFTAASQTVTIDMEVSVQSMDWTGVTNNPALQGTSYDLHIGGSLILAPASDMSVSLTQKIYFTSDASGNSINMNGFTFPSASIYFSGSGEWNILSDLTLRNLYFNGGTLNTNDHQISLNTTMGSGATAVRNLNLGSSLIITKDWNFTDSTNLNIDASAATIQVSGTILNTGYQNYHNISLTGSGTVNIYKDASIDSLYIAPGLTVALQAGITLAIDKISATGSCGDLTVIKSRTSGVEATITKSSDTLAVEYVQLQDIHATGGAAFINYNGFDNGNNDGWTIDFLTSTTYYWVGNSGNWSDPAHWALSSGGTGNGGCYPNYYDDVIFDENSFTGAGGTVTLDQAAYCHNMDWSQVTGTGNLAGAYNLHIDGSFDISTINSYNLTEKLYFRSDEIGNTINTGGVSLNQNVYFSGSGEWTLQSEFTVGPSRRLMFNSGTLHTNNYNMNLYEFYSESSNIRYLDLGSSVINCTHAWLLVDGTNMTLDPGTSEIISFSAIFRGGGFEYYNVTNNYSPSIVLEGPNTFHILSMPNVSRIYLAGLVQTMDSLVVPDGTGCDNLLEISPVYEFDTLSLNITSGTFTVNYWDISNVTATGGATFNANNSIGHGDVTGWNFSSSTIDIGNDTSICEGDSILLDAGVGNSYLWSTGETTQTIYASATDTYSVTVTSTCGYAKGEISVNVIPRKGANDIISACESYTWIDGVTYTENNNTATDTLTNVNGCDSIVTLDLTILKPSAGIDVISACESYTWIDGITYTENNNTATYTLNNAVGCDSVVTLNLTILEPSTGTDVISACESYTWIDGITYTESNNTATYTLTNAVGCDSVVTLDLTILKSSTGTDVIKACESYTWIDGINYAKSNNKATYTLTNAEGCDSIVTLNLTIADTCNLNSVSRISNSDILIYPTPVHDRLVVELPSADFSKIDILDITGKIVLTKHIEGKETVLEDLNFKSGTYILRIFGNDQSVNTSLIIKN